MPKTAMIVWNTMLHDARVTKEAQTLARHGHEVCVFCVTTGGDIPVNQKMEPGFSIHRVYRTPLDFIRRALSRRGSNSVPAPAGGRDRRPADRVTGGPGVWAYRTLNFGIVHLVLLFRMVKYRPEIVHAHDVNTLPTAWLAARLSGAKLIYDAHEISTDREGYGKLRKIVFAVEKLLIPGAVAVITTTDMRAKHFARAYKCKRPAVLQNRPRRSLAKFEDRSFLRRHFGIDDRLPIVLYQGGLQQGRGLEMLVRAASKIDNAAFVFVGDGLLSRTLTELIVELNLQERVFILPAVPLSDLPEITASADIGVQPIENTCLNHYTTDSNKLFEYLHAGLPVVAANLPEIAKVVIPYRCGLVFPPGDLQGLTAALEALLADEARRSEFATMAVRAAEVYSWENQEHVLLDIYSSATRNDAPLDD